MRTNQSYLSLYRPAAEIRESAIQKAGESHPIDVLPAATPDSVRVVLFLEFTVEGPKDEEGWKALEIAHQLAHFTGSKV